MRSAVSPLRVGRIVALNMFPVYYALEQAGLTDVAFTDGLPTTLNRAVLDGRLDMSAMSSIEYARHADDLTLMPIGSITAAGAVDSIQVFSRVPFERMGSVAVTTDSATSVALLRILVGPDVSFRPLSGSVWEELESVDGVLLIADRALAEMRSPSAPYATDLGERWKTLTGLPMVFAVWVVRHDAMDRHFDRLDAVAAIVRDASERHRLDPDAIVRAAADRFPFPEDFIRHYFTRLSYDFGAAEKASLERFFALAHEAGELDTIPSLPVSP